MNVSIIIPVYNVSAYIERCVSSVINQDYNGSMECILVDDCSPDDSIDKCLKLIKNYKGPISFRIVKHEKNKGLSGARNTGTVNSVGEYLYYLDSDDEITPKCISSLMSVVSEYPDVEMIQGSTRCIPDKAYYHKEKICAVKYKSDNRWVRFQYYANAFPVNAWNKLVKRDFIINNNLFFYEGIIHEDEHWMFYVVKKLKNVSFTQKETYIHYVTEGSIMTSSGSKKSNDNWVRIVSLIVNDYDEPFYWLQVKRYFFKFMGIYSQTSQEYDETLYLYKKLFEKKNERIVLFLLNIYMKHQKTNLGVKSKDVMLKYLGIKWRILEGTIKIQ